MSANPDDQFTSDFDAALDDADIRVIKSPSQTPRANAVCEKLIGTLRRELLDRILIHGETHPESPWALDQPWTSPGSVSRVSCGPVGASSAS